MQHGSPSWTASLYRWHNSVFRATNCKFQCFTDNCTLSISYEPRTVRAQALDSAARTQGNTEHKCHCVLARTPGWHPRRYTCHDVVEDLPDGRHELDWCGARYINIPNMSYSVGSSWKPNLLIFKMSR